MASLLIPQQLIPPTGTTLAGIRFAEGVSSIAGWFVTGATPTLTGTKVYFDTPESVTALNVSVSSIDFINLPICPVLDSLDCSTNDLTALDFRNCLQITTVDCSYNSLTSLDVSGIPLLASLNCSNNSLTSLDVSGCPLLTTLDASDNGMSAAAVDAVLAALNANGAAAGTVTLTGNTAPTAAGLESKALLEFDGWTVNVDA